MYRVSLQQFEGPLDLLLFFIRRDEIDIYDIPIAQIADEFLGYVRLMEQVDLDSVGDFIYMASLLISIKARMLLPVTETDEEGEPIDPRRELVERLLEYVRFKEASQKLEQRRAWRSERYTRRVAGDNRSLHETSPGEAEVDNTLYDLVSALRGLLTTVPEDEEPVHAVEREVYSVEEQQAYVLETLASGQQVAFRELVKRRSKAFVIATFLAVLELARRRYLTLALGETRRHFFVQRRKDALPVHEPGGDGAIPDPSASPTNGTTNGASS